MNKDKRFMKVIALALCLVLGIFAFESPQVVYGDDVTVRKLNQIRIEAKVNSSWDTNYDETFYQEIKDNYKFSYRIWQSPLKIGTADELAAFAKVVNEGPNYNFQGRYVELTANIDLEGSDVFIDDREGDNRIMKGDLDNVWVPIGIDSDHNFRGTFDGKNHEIQNMVVLNESSNGHAYSGFFGVLANDGTIRNLGIKGGNVLSKTAAKSTADSNAGGLVGWNGKGGRIEASYSTAVVTACAAGTSMSSGGIVGAFHSNAGGLVGINDGSIETSYSMGAAMSYSKSFASYDSAAGGLVGRNGGSIKASYSTGNVMSSGSAKPRAGGLVGENRGSIETSYSMGAVMSSSMAGSTVSTAGGLVGHNNGYIKTSYSMGDVTSFASKNTSSAGGLVGWNSLYGSIKASYSTGAVSSTSDDSISKSNAGGLVGGNDEEATIEDSYRNKEAKVTADGTAGEKIITEDGTPLSPREMTGREPGRAETIMTGFDGDIWVFEADSAITGTAGAPDCKQTWYYPMLKVITYTEDLKPKYIKTGSRLSDEVTNVSITGTPTVGKTLTAQAEGTNLNDIKYQWYVEGAGISGEDQTYVVKESDVGKLVTVTVYKSAKLGTLDDRVKIFCSVVITNPAGSHIKWISGSQSQNSITGLMEAVVYEAESDYYFPEGYSIKPVNGIQVKRNSYTRITVSGTPTGNVSITLPSVTAKEEQKAPSGLCDESGKIKGTTTAMEYASSPEATRWNACKNGSTAVNAGTWYVRYKETETKKAGTAVRIMVAPIPSKVPTPPKPSIPSKVPTPPKPSISLKAPKTKVSTTYNSAKVSWKKVSKAAGYQVYRAGRKNGKYKKVKTTGKISWTNKKLTTGKTYYYKVRAYKKTGGKTVCGSFSKKVKAVPRTKAPGFKLTAGNNKIRVAWNKAEGATGYRIYRARSKKGKYKMIKDSRNVIRHYTSICLTDKHKYYYKIRSYKIVKGKRVYSAYSKVKSKRTK